MNRLLAALLALLLVSCGKPPPQADIPLDLPPDSTHLPVLPDSLVLPYVTAADSVWPGLEEGLYLNTGVTADSARLHAALRSARAAGLNIVCFDVKTMRGDITIRLPERDDLLPHPDRGLHNLSRLTRTLHDYDMRSVARLVMFHDSWLAARRPDLRPYSSPGVPWCENERKAPAWLDPSHPEVQRDLLALIDVVARSGVDEIQLDYVRFPTQGAIDDAWFAFEWEDELVEGSDGHLCVPRKPDVIAAFVRQAREVCDRYGVELSADVFAIVLWGREVDIEKTGQDLRQMTPWLHRVHPMLYSSHFAPDFSHRNDVPNEPYQIVFDSVSRCREMTDDNCLVMPYLQAMTWGVDFSSQYVLAQVQAARHAGADGYLMWHSSSWYSKLLPWLQEYKESGAL
ncbi:MAG: putative glycoside hydrolase [Candidatus Cloacimonetes bacterium]|nr:putative glycoside hydrolase [Candidatus Cloacimonadota bacterium]